MITPLENSKENVLGFKLSGKLHDEDYAHFVPAVDKAVKEHGKVRLLAQFEDFHGWDMHALWDDFKFGTRHYRDVERTALVGENRWEKWMATVCKPFTKGEVRYFDRSKLDDAWTWVGDGAKA